MMCDNEKRRWYSNLLIAGIAAVVGFVAGVLPSYFQNKVAAAELAVQMAVGSRGSGGREHADGARPLYVDVLGNYYLLRNLEQPRCWPLRFLPWRTDHTQKTVVSELKRARDLQDAALKWYRDNTEGFEQSLRGDG